ncbi:hypothetical protein Clacol_003780 [Clathrus columnatus]|uniref:1,3-beta-glucanosyltransferase n=1 Tax=Clathrus columnatus TaxID=1419009 RepID=A0AAV5A4N8_9AGAM|nr:hypothetical protein Clacol_003780 [Clathrus columnatus]
MLFSKLCGLAVLIPLIHALNPITRRGKYLYDSVTNTRFSFKGVAYQQQGATANDPNDQFAEPSNFLDPLADSAGCKRDLPVLGQLQINAIRTYSVNSTLNHDDCMEAFNNAGIYVVLDLSTPGNSINRAAPEWTTTQLDEYISTINAFLKYDNVLAFNVANEVVAQLDVIPNATEAAPYIKAAARDVKAFLRSKNSTALVSYTSTDGPDTWRQNLFEYLSCDSDATSVDIFGLNNYEWCGDSNFQASYAGTEQTFSISTVPLMFSEFGCVTSPPRLWTEVAALFGPEMNQTWSGGIAFSYFPAEGGYGLVNLTNNNETVVTNEDFARLQAQYANLTLPSTPTEADAGQDVFSACPTPSASIWLASTNLPPTPNDEACQCLEQNAFSCKFIQTNSPQESAIVGELINTACSLLGQNNGSCDPIGGSGITGDYGAISFCDPITKLNYAMSEFFDITNRNPVSCNFDGNATAVPNAPSPTQAQAAASSCLANLAATFTPTSPATSSGSGSNSGPGSSGSTSGGFKTAVTVISLTWVVMISAGLWTLLV